MRYRGLSHSLEYINGLAGPLTSYHKNQSAFEKRPFPESHSEGKTMGSSNGTNGRTGLPEKRKNTPRRDGKIENGDWLAAQLSQRSVIEVTEFTGMSDKAVQNIRRRKSKLSFDNLVDLCRNDPDFAAAFAEHVGLILPGEAEFAGALTQAFNAYGRRNG